MKSYLVFLCVVVAANALSQEFKDKVMAKLQAAAEKCTEETGATADDIAGLIAKKPPTTHEGQCMIFCMHKIFKVQKDDGSTGGEEAIKFLDPLKENDPALHDKMVQIYQTCANAPTDPDPCVFATNLATCGIKTARELGIEDPFM
uniref:Odorant-binding protein 4 n=1 Tax=Dastarcus helophoroides TaxID=1169899 RepID=A0A1I9HZP6_9CUCU|nr:odorant-binding protein 4 [Dastarcus helophoroides]